VCNNSLKVFRSTGEKKVAPTAQLCSWPYCGLVFLFFFFLISCFCFCFSFSLLEEKEKPTHKKKKIKKRPPEKKKKTKHQRKKTQTKKHTKKTHTRMDRTSERTDEHTDKTRMHRPSPMRTFSPKNMESVRFLLDKKTPKIKATHNAFGYYHFCLSLSHRTSTSR